MEFLPSGKACDLYAGGSRFESRQVHQLLDFFILYSDQQMHN